MSEPEPLPVVRPVAGAVVRAKPPRSVLALAAVLALVCGTFAVLAAAKPAGRPGKEAARPVEPPRFGAGTEARVAALANRLTAGLLSLGGADGRFSPRPGDQSLDPLEEVEATGMAIAGLAAAKRLGEPAPALDGAIDRACRWLGARQKEDGGFGQAMQPQNRALPVSAAGAATFGVVLAGRKADGAFLDRAAGFLRYQADAGRLPDGWTRALVAMAALGLIETGHAAGLGDDPWAVVQTRDIGTVRDARDQRVAEALARAIRARGGAADAVPSEVLAKVVDEGFEWGGDRTDMASWAMRAWLASRTPGGDRWFVGILAPLETAPDAGGVVQGDFYGYPVSRTASALLILLEGKDLRGPFWGAGG